MDLTFYMTVNEEAALNKEISMPATKNIAFLSNRLNLHCAELFLCTLGVAVCSVMFSNIYLNLFLFHHSLNYSSIQTSSRKVLECDFHVLNKVQVTTYIKSRKSVSEYTSLPECFMKFQKNAANF